jgi:hypothetical protein
MSSEFAPEQRKPQLGALPPTNPCVLSCQTDFLMSDAGTSYLRCSLQIPFAKNFATSLPVTGFQTVLSVDLLPPFLSCLYSSVTMLKS